MKKTSKILFLFLSFVILFSISAQAVYASTINDTVTITFNINGGNGANSTRTRTPGEPIGTLPSSPTRSGHEFVGWYPAQRGAFDPDLRLTSTTSTPNQDTIYYARWLKGESKTLTHTGSMLIQGMKGLTTDSTPITFNGNTIPAKAKITSISVSTGKSTVSGFIIGNYLQISSTSRPEALKIPWNGADNSVLENKLHFWDYDARATYTVLWNGTVNGNTPGTILNPNGTAAIRGYSNVKLTINYTVPVE